MSTTCPRCDRENCLALSCVTAYERGRTEERKKVVAFFKGEAGYFLTERNRLAAAHAIENGEHDTS